MVNGNCSGFRSFQMAKNFRPWGNGFHHIKGDSRMVEATSLSTLSPKYTRSKLSRSSGENASNFWRNYDTTKFSGGKRTAPNKYGIPLKSKYMFSIRYKTQSPIPPSAIALSHATRQPAWRLFALTLVSLAPRLHPRLFLFLRSQLCISLLLIIEPDM